jgi:hypothetical protein
MTARHDPERLIRTYLEDGPTELPDHSYDAVRATIDHTRQRAVFGPWREPDMSKFMPFAIGAAAVLIVAAVVGINLVPSGGVGAPGVSPTPSAIPSAVPPSAPPLPGPSPTVALSPSPGSTPSSTLGARILPINGELEPGTYFISRPGVVNAERLWFTVPAGWATEDYGFVAKHRDTPGEVLFVTWVVTHVFSDVCQWEGSLVEAGTTVDSLVTALSEQEGLEASEPTDTTVGGFPAKRIELTVPAHLDTSTCSSGNLHYWPGPGPDMDSGMCCNRPGNTDAIYVVDVNGSREVIVARHHPDSSPESIAELQSIIDSITIEP